MKLIDAGRTLPLNSTLAAAWVGTDVESRDTAGSMALFWCQKRGDPDLDLDGL
jgi:hypothetical protein